MMHPSLRVDVPDEERAASLRRRLQPFDVEIEPVDGHLELRVGLVDFNPERRVGEALSAIDGWLVTSGLQSVRIHLDGSSYTLHVPPAPEAA
jgi:hypothetical protein